MCPLSAWFKPDLLEEFGPAPVLAGAFMGYQTNTKKFFLWHLFPSDLTSRRIVSSPNRTRSKNRSMVYGLMVSWSDRQIVPALFKTRFFG
jgi:hypothetical protein